MPTLRPASRMPTWQTVWGATTAIRATWLCATPFRESFNRTHWF